MNAIENTFCLLRMNQNTKRNLLKKKIMRREGGCYRIYKMEWSTVESINTSNNEYIHM